MVGNHKLQTQVQWNKNPCGTGSFLKDIEPESLAYFDEIRRMRYEVSDPWMLRQIPFGSVTGKRLLEIGYGVGSDLLTFAESGAEVHGIDLTQEHYRLASLNFSLHGIQAELQLGDAAFLDYPSNYFDIVYSFGVLHHTPDTERCISEASRVLRPGGLLIIGMYRRYSAFHLVCKLLFDGLLHGKLFSLGYKGLMATLERGADGVDIKPLVKTYSKRQLLRLLKNFSDTRFSVAHFRRDHLCHIGRLLPESIERPLEPYLGWYLLAFATK